MLGVNVGQLGYLTEVEPADLDVALERLAPATTRSTSAWCSRSSWTSGVPGRPLVGLNEAVLEKGAARAAWPASTSASTGPSSRRTRPTASSSPRRRARPRTPSRPRADRVAAPPVPAAHAGVAAHALRPLARARRRRGAALHRHRRRSVVLTARRPRARHARAGRRGHMHRRGRSPARIVTFGLRDFHQILKAKFGLADR